MKLYRLVSILIALCFSTACSENEENEESQEPAVEAPAVEAYALDGPTESPTLATTRAAPTVEPVAIEPTPEAPVPRRPPVAGETVEVPAGTQVLGSPSGTRHRMSDREADLVSVQVPAFSIDRLPFPNDPAQPMRTQVTHGEAAALCEAAGKRLCTEVEWERACSVEAGDTMGTRGAEWTASASNFSREGTMVFRGAAEGNDAHLMRCASRRSATSETQSRHIGFRCCSGETPSPSYPAIEDYSRFRRRTVENARLQEILTNIPALAPFAEDFELHTQAQQEHAVGESDLNGWELTQTVLEWSPRTGDRLWVFSGKSGRDTLIVALYRDEGDTFRHGASFILEDERRAIAIAYTPPSRDELLWSANWGGYGEGGTIALREDGTIAVLHR